MPAQSLQSASNEVAHVLPSIMHMIAPFVEAAYLLLSSFLLIDRSNKYEIVLSRGAAKPYHMRAPLSIFYLISLYVARLCRLFL